MQHLDSKLTLNCDKDSSGNRMGERSNASSTSSLALPTIPGASPEGGASPRRAVSPLLEVRRPHCTLNCDHCSCYLEDLYKQSRFIHLTNNKKINTKEFQYYSLIVSTRKIEMSRRIIPLCRL